MIILGLNALHANVSAALLIEGKFLAAVEEERFTHIDGTGGRQTVDKIISPQFYNLINIFREKTVVPILLNTSFSENEIIVNTPQEAVNFYVHKSMDMLVIENCLIQRT